MKMKMSCVGVLAAILLCLNLFVTPASAAYTSFSEVGQAIANGTYDPDQLPSDGKDLPPDQAVDTTFLSRAAFDAAYPGAPLEDFEDTLVSPNNIGVDFGPINSSTNNTVYVPGAIMDGISIDAIDGDTNDFAVLTAGYFGVPSTVLGPNTFTDNTVIVFSESDVSAVAMDIFTPLTGGDFEIFIYGPGDVLQDTVNFTADADGEFFGIETDTPITRIVISGVNGDEAELIDNLSFGVSYPANVPTLSQWGMIIMAILLAGIGVMVLRRGSFFAAV